MDRTGWKAALEHLSNVGLMIKTNPVYDSIKRIRQNLIRAAFFLHPWQSWEKSTVIWQHTLLDLTTDSELKHLSF
jgi:hypothetical protein